MPGLYMTTKQMLLNTLLKIQKKKRPSKFQKPNLMNF